MCVIVNGIWLICLSSVKTVESGIKLEPSQWPGSTQLWLIIATQGFGPSAAIKSLLFRRNLKYLSLKKSFNLKTNPFRNEQTHTLLLNRILLGLFLVWFCEPYPSNVVRELGHTVYIKRIWNNGYETMLNTTCIYSVFTHTIVFIKNFLGPRPCVS